MRRRAAAAALALLSVFLALPAPPASAEQLFRPVVTLHDFDSATPTACVLGPQVTGLGVASTAGSSTTVTAATTGAFSVLAAGAELTLGNQVAYVVTPGASSVTVGDALTVAAGTAWSYRLLTCGTAAGAGWFGVGDFTPRRTWVVQVDQISLLSGSLAVELWCRQSSPVAAPQRVYPALASGTACETGLFTAATTTGCSIVDNDIDYSQCRWLVTLTDDAGDTGANREKVTITVTGGRQ